MKEKTTAGDADKWHSKEVLGRKLTFRILFQDYSTHSIKARDREVI